MLSALFVSRAASADIPEAEPTVAPLPAPAPAPPRSIALRHNLALDIPITAGLAGALITWGVVVKPNLRAPSCTICDGAPGELNAVDDFFRSSLRRPADSPAGAISDVFAYGVAPATGVALAVIAPAYDHRTSEVPLDMLLVVEASLAFAVVQQGLTVLLPRERPYVHAAEGEERDSALQRHSSFEAFPAGHNGSAFAIAAAGGTIATMRGYRLAPLVWRATAARSAAPLPPTPGFPPPRTPAAYPTPPSARRPLSSCRPRDRTGQAGRGA